MKRLLCVSALLLALACVSQAQAGGAARVRVNAGVVRVNAGRVFNRVFVPRVFGFQRAFQRVFVPRVFVRQRVFVPQAFYGYGQQQFYQPQAFFAPQQYNYGCYGQQFYQPQYVPQYAPQPCAPPVQVPQVIPQAPPMEPAPCVDQSQFYQPPAVQFAPSYAPTCGLSAPLAFNYGYQGIGGYAGSFGLRQRVFFSNYGGFARQRVFFRR